MGCGGEVRGKAQGAALKSLGLETRRRFGELNAALAGAPVIYVVRSGYLRRSSTILHQTANLNRALEP